MRVGLDLAFSGAGLAARSSLRAASGLVAAACGRPNNSRRQILGGVRVRTELSLVPVVSVAGEAPGFAIAAVRVLPARGRLGRSEAVTVVVVEPDTEGARWWRCFL